MGAFLPPPPAPTWAAAARRAAAVGQGRPPPSLRPPTTGCCPRRVRAAAGARSSGTVAAAAGLGDGAAGGDGGGGGGSRDGGGGGGGDGDGWGGRGGGGGGGGAAAADGGAVDPAVAAAADPSTASGGSGLRPGDVLDMDWDALVSDEDYVVVDSKDVDALVAQMSAAGLDDLYALDPQGAEDEEEEVGNAVGSGGSRRGGGAAAGAAGAAAATTRGHGDGGNATTSQSAAAAAAAADEVYARRGETAFMEYFSDENVAHMPRWAADAYAAGEHEALEAGADAIASSRGSRRLDAVRMAGLAAKAKAAAKKRRGRWDDLEDAEVVGDLGEAPQRKMHYAGADEMGGSGRVGGEAGLDGEYEEEEDEEEEEEEDADLGEGLGGSMVDCTVEAVAEDYNVPVECVVDLMDDFGVRRPIWQDDRIRDRLMTEEIEQLLRVLTSFDALDLNDRYSDRSLDELSDLYDTPIGKVSLTADALGFFLPLGTATRLRVDREEALIDALTQPTSASARTVAEVEKRALASDWTVDDDEDDEDEDENSDEDDEDEDSEEDDEDAA